jgi:hypothetical protein
LLVALALANFVSAAITSAARLGVSLRLPSDFANRLGEPADHLRVLNGVRP